MWEAEGWAWRSQSHTAMAESISDCFTVPLARVLSPLRSRQRFFVLADASLSFPLPLFLSPSLFFFCMCVCVLTIEMSSLSSMEHGITSQVVWFNTAVHSCRRASKMLAKKKCCLSFDFHYSLSLCLRLSLLSTEIMFIWQASCEKFNY